MLNYQYATAAACTDDSGFALDMIDVVEPFDMTVARTRRAGLDHLQPVKAAVSVQLTSEQQQPVLTIEQQATLRAKGTTTAADLQERRSLSMGARSRVFAMAEQQQQQQLECEDADDATCTSLSVEMASETASTLLQLEDAPLTLAATQRVLVNDEASSADPMRSSGNQQSVLNQAAVHVQTREHLSVASRQSFNYDLVDARCMAGAEMATWMTRTPVE